MKSLEAKLLEPQAVWEASTATATPACPTISQLHELMHLVSHGGRLLDAFTAPLAHQILRSLHRSPPDDRSAIPSPSQLRASIRSDCETFIRGEECAADDERDARKVAVLGCAHLMLSVFLQSSWTGPPEAPQRDSERLNEAKQRPFIDGPPPQRFADVCVLGDPALPAIDTPFSLRALVDDMAVDGELIYERALGVPYLWAARELLDVPCVADMASHAVWSGRLAFVWQRSLLGGARSPAPTLVKRCLEDGSEALKRLGLLTESFSVKMDAIDQDDTSAPQVASDLPLSREAQAALVLELALRLAFYGRTKPYTRAASRACSIAGFEFSITGARGIRRQYQTNALPQLVVLTKSQAADNGARSSQGQEAGEVQDVKLTELDPDTDILERPRLLAGEGGENGSIERPLTALEQALLLTRCASILESAPVGDELAAEELNALVQRCLVLPSAPPSGQEGSQLSANWLVYSAGLYFRSRSELHRTKTMDRACLQLQALIDQYDDPTPPPSHRLAFVHCVDYPSRWEAHREAARHLRRTGALLSAFERFASLHMWEEGLECLIAAGREQQAEKLLRERLAAKPTPPLWCSLGDVTRDPQCYEEAWRLSNHHYARAMRSLGRHFFSQGAESLPRSVECFTEALALNPLHVNAWFTKGCACMRLARWDEALEAFARVVAIDPESHEAWANLAGVHLNRGSVSEARLAIEEAAKRAPQNWRVADNKMLIAMRCEDAWGAVEGARQLLALGRLEELGKIDLVKGLTGLVTSRVKGDEADDGKGSSGQLLKTYVGFLDDLAGRISATPAAQAPLWRILGELHEDHLADPSTAYSYRMKECRTLQSSTSTQPPSPGGTGGFLDQLLTSTEALIRLAQQIDQEKKTKTETGMAGGRPPKGPPAGDLGSLRLLVRSLCRKVCAWREGAGEGSEEGQRWGEGAARLEQWEADLDK
ncbi:unnamed protein product [Vitrella brassicaformis CCMP3155]|uniref:Uncharacterized protein n=2 Tax=Vitrella brassicaformis TaxID=1169539 RepID=A0A0G4F1R5_VITBC|nr:unnamed protein product [Vitrella brassicaformis CCMP3155]|eukprot:CEM05675.1 unnamed protein product [Vitrella brassicaformis CCMP3155]